MKNREWLNSLNDDDLAREMLIITNKIQKDNFHDEIGIFEFAEDCTFDLEDWLKAEHI